MERERMVALQEQQPKDWRAQTQHHCSTHHVTSLSSDCTTCPQDMRTLQKDVLVYVLLYIEEIEHRAGCGCFMARSVVHPEKLTVQREVITDPLRNVIIFPGLPSLS